MTLSLWQWILLACALAFVTKLLGYSLPERWMRSPRMAQIAACTVVLSAGFMLLGQSLAGAAVLGMGLALSSTAVVMPVMAERGRMKGVVGRSTFAVLLAQDLAVAPILITVTVLATVALSGWAA